MSDTGERHDNNPENKTEFDQYQHEHQANLRDPKSGDWRNKLADSMQRSLEAVRNRKAFTHLNALRPRKTFNRSK